MRLNPKTPLLCMWLVVAMVAVMAQGCATSYKPTVTGPGPFAYTPTPEQCRLLLKEKRTYRATEKTAIYVSTATALVATALLAIPALREETAAQGAAAGVTLAAGGVAMFSGSQVESLEEEIGLGSCLNQPPPPMPGGGPTVPDLPTPKPGGMLSESKAFNRQEARR